MLMVGHVGLCGSTHTRWEGRARALPLRATKPMLAMLAVDLGSLLWKEVDVNREIHQWLIRKVVKV
jgi:hypothetical protein